MPSSFWKLTPQDAAWLCDNIERQGASRAIPVAVAIVDDGGHLLRFTETEGVKVVAAELALAKAWTSAVLRRPSGAYQAVVEPGATSYGLLNAFPGRMLPVGGGHPILFDELCIGAVGVTGGGTAEDDADISAQAVAGFVAAFSPMTGDRGDKP